MQRKGLGDVGEALHDGICIWMEAAGPLGGAGTLLVHYAGGKEHRAYLDLWLQRSTTHDAFALCMFIISGADGADLLRSRAEHLELHAILEAGICKGTIDPPPLVDQLLV